MIRSLDQQEVAVKSGYWPLFRFNPMLAAQGKNPLVLDSKAPSVPLTEFTNNETRYTMLVSADPAAAKTLGELAQQDVNARWKLYSHWATMAGEGAK
jgi:pyruvate-ferredoxin/flavodoxin oxidoreductase